MKKILPVSLCLVLLLTGFSVFAQKTVVAIKTLRKVSQNQKQNYYTRDNTTAVSNGEAKIEDLVTSIFVNLKRFTIVDRNAMGALKSEKELQKTEDFIDSKVIEQSKTLGAEYLIGINIASIETQQKITSNHYGTSVSYSGNINFSVKIIDISSSQIVASETFTSDVGNGILNFTKTAENAIDKCLRNVSDNVEEFIKNNFPLKAKIANIEESDNSGAATKVLVSIGSTSGVRKGDVLRVMEVTELDVDGKKMTRKKEVGNLVVRNIEDENFSVCEVKKGGAEIAQKTKEGKKLLIQAEITN